MKKANSAEDDMRLNQLLKHLTYEHVQGSQSREITDICYHSGNVREGSLFVCLKGLHTEALQKIIRSKYLNPNFDQLL